MGEKNLILFLPVAPLPLLFNFRSFVAFHFPNSFSTFIPFWPLNHHTAQPPFQILDCLPYVPPSRPRKETKRADKRHHKKIRELRHMTNSNSFSTDPAKPASITQPPLLSTLISSVRNSIYFQNRRCWKNHRSVFQIPMYCSVDPY